MDLRLDGRTAFVSGSTQGIGHATARALAQEGAAVILNGRDEARLGEAVEQLRTAVPGAEVSGLVADFADAAAVERLLPSLDDVDVLVNNVGLFDLRPFADIPDSEWQRYLEVNLMSGVRL